MDQARSLPRPGPPPYGRLYLIGGALFILLLLASAAGLAFALRASALSEARRGVEQLSIALAEQTARSLQAVDLVLQDTASRVEAAAAKSGAAVGEAMASPEVNGMLRERLRNMPQLDAITLVDPKGRIVNFTRTFPPPPMDVADREYFRAFQDGTRTVPFISAPLRSRVSGQWSLFLARPVEPSASQPPALVLAVIPVGAIEGVYQAVTTKPGSSVTLLREDGLILARFPREDSMLGQVRPASDGEPLLVARTTLARNGLVLEVSVSEWAALAGWRRQAVAILLFAAAAATCMGLMLRTITRQLGAERDAKAALGARNRDLEEASCRLAAQARELEQTAAALRGGERLLAERSATLNTTLEHIDQGIMMVDANKTVAAYNRRVVEMLGLPDELLARRPGFDEVLQYQWETGEFTRTAPNVRAFVRSGGILERAQVYERERPNGRTIEVRSLPLPGGGIVRTYTDITERKAAEARIQRTALFDELTGLPNRVALGQALAEKLPSCAEGQRLALLYIDLDRFRLINDASGHEVGDRLLVEAGQRVRAEAGPEDVVCRIGGDEFAVVQLCEPGDEAQALADRLLARLAEPYVVNGRRLAVTASIGLAVAEHEADPETLRRNADIAMYLAKDAGRNRLRRYEPSMAAAQQEQFQLEQALREALDQDAFQLLYQPVVAVESNAVVGYEALLRWTDRVRGEVAPPLFIPVAEANGLIVPLGRWVLERACREAASWPNTCSVAVNLSPVQFQQPEFLEMVLGCLSRSGLTPDRLELEITEGVLLQDSGAVLETMHALRRAGVSITLDDFGTGHASLSYLRRFPFDKIKIDKSFIRNLRHDRSSDAIVDAVLLLGRRLGLRVVAEGVEDEAQLAQLRAMHCPYVQGFLTGRPMAAEMARAL
ncbi:MAG TPA: EAL domain-containing protein [Acetobacteraceae bacterium]|nr:EAL domain-containing protein [Acetobacteraceae bacterium]